MEIKAAHVIGILIVLALITGVGIWSGRKVKDASDFSGGGQAGAAVVIGTIMGTIVSGQATVGTAQLAFSYGLSAWWFTLGAGIGCLILAVGYARPLRHSGSQTLAGVIADEYGNRCDYAASVFSSLGIFISVIAQMISATALLTSIFPISLTAAAIISVVVMAVYIIFGGVWGAGLGGLVKLLLLYASAVAGGAVVLAVAHGIPGLAVLLQGRMVGTGLGRINHITSVSDLSGRFASMLARGPMKDLGGGISLALGVICTQSYASAVWAAKSDKAARRGSLACAFLVPPIGAACILIGLFMRGHCVTAAEAAALIHSGAGIPHGMFTIANSAQVFPQFVIHYLPPLFGGIVLGTLFITVVGGGAGLSFGVSTIIVNDILGRMRKKVRSATSQLVLIRTILVLVLAAGGAVALLMPSAMINDFGFLSMGLRGAVIFLPMTAALCWKGKVNRKWVLAAIIAGPLTVICGNLLHTAVDPLFIGIAVNFVLILIGRIAGPAKKAG